MQGKSFRSLSSANLNNLMKRKNTVTKLIQMQEISEDVSDEKKSVGSSTSGLSMTNTLSIGKSEITN